MSSIKGADQTVPWLDFSKTPKERVQAFIDMNSARDADSTPTYDTPLTRLTTLHHATPTSTTFTLSPLPPSLSNLSRTALHGGAIATAFDLLTSLTFIAAARPGFWDGMHVTRTLGVTYLNPVRVSGRDEGIDDQEKGGEEGEEREGEERKGKSGIWVECEVVGELGGRMGVVRGVMRELAQDGKVGRVVCVCEHGKVFLGSDSSPTGKKKKREKEKAKM